MPFRKVEAEAIRFGSFVRNYQKIENKHLEYKLIN